VIASVSTSVINGSLAAPASKSTMQRACALGLLNDGMTFIQNAGNSNDDLAALDIIKHLGATIEQPGKQEIIITSDGNTRPADVIHCGESGLSLRMFAPLIALSGQMVRITGEGSLLKRPVDFFDKVLPGLHVNVQTNGGFLPVQVQGPLVPGNIRIDASLSSQYLTGLLFAFAKAAEKEVTIFVDGLKSKPYIDLSLHLLQQFGYDVRHDAYTRFFIVPAEKKKRDVHYVNEGDWSGAAFLLVAGAAAGDLKLTGLQEDSMQADRAILTVLKQAGADMSIHPDHIRITNANKLYPFTFDATDCPDLFPPLAALAANCDGTSVIKGTSRLVAKESDRAKSLADIFSKMGVPINVAADEMTITGGNISGANVDAHHDHRIVMAAAVAGLRASGDVVITGAEAINKSYPAFFNDMKKAGAAISLSNDKI
jgi:3-phosphoshikimate 1-carboxyvinyltransferase